MPILQTKSLYYNDVNLIGQPGTTLRSRSEVPNEKWRIIVSPMDSLISKELVIEAARNGISIFLHRFKNLEWQIDLYRNFYDNVIYSNQICCVSLGLKNFKRDLDILDKENIKDAGIDIANGYLDLKYYAEFIPDNYFENFFVGNVHNKAGFDELGRTFFDKTKHLMIRVGIGGGSPCSSSDVAGVNRGNITELIECHRAGWKDSKVSVLADGGIKKPGYASKAFAAGAKYIMMGGYFRSAKEAETNLRGDGAYWGGASDRQLQIIGQPDKISEGKVIQKDKEIELKPLSVLVKELWGGLASYVTYSGYDSLEQVIGNGIFEVKQNSLPPKDRM
jgi:GMP reductase